MLSKSSTFDRALVEFAQKTSELTQTAVDNRKYVLVEKLQAWMRKPKSSLLDKQYRTNTELLLRAAYRTESFLPIEPWRINEKGHKCSLVVFSILLDLGLGNWIAKFVAKGILDSKLPFDLHSLERKLSGEGGGDHAAERFNERQWKFCPAIFGLGMEEDYVENQIIPICRQSEINTGGTARVDQIVMQAEFVDPSLRNKLQNDHFASYDDRDYGHCFIFALKVFEPGSFQYYTDEKAAFDRLRENRGVIHRLGCYTHQTLIPSQPTIGQANGEQQTFERKTTKNLLLEYGTYDLRLIFGHKSPPVLSKEILGFWEALFEVADAVSGIHNFKTGGSEFNRWHADIKPENIIYVQGKYKLADPGFARFKKKLQGQKGHTKSNAPQIRVRGGTNTYGAPEVSSKADVHQTIDIWSLGCVFSMAATWVILGYQGVRQYLLVRRKALEAILHHIKEDDHKHPLLVSHGLNANSIPRQLDCFHNGSNVLKEVTSWHALLRASIRKTDPITEAVLALIDTKMLLRDPEKRIKSATLCEELRRIISSAKVSNRDTVAQESSESREHREHMEGLLKEIDNEVVDQGIEEESREPTQPIPPGLPTTRHALKAQLEGVPLQKTSHRFETLPDLRTKPDMPTVAANYPSIVTSNALGFNEVPQYTDSQPESSFSAETRNIGWRPNSGHLSRHNTGLTSRTRKTLISISPYTYENVLQARERLDRESKRTISNMGRREPRKNKFLGKHFENRDIKYLVDDSESMFDHWDEATFLLETLVMKAHDQDPDGPDLAFMNDSRDLTRQRDAKEFRKLMNKAQPRKDGGVRTNIKKSLERIFHRYLEMVQHTHTKTRVNSLTIIILTDGLWTGMMNDQDAVIPLIQNFYRQLKDDMEGKLRGRQVSIQFVQFGSDQEARERLRRLDDDLPYLGIDDMVDHEMFSVSGNVFKMLLGSFVEEMDAMDEVEDVASSPEPSQPNIVLPCTDSRPLVKGITHVQPQWKEVYTSLRRTLDVNGKEASSGSLTLMANTGLSSTSDAENMISFSRTTDPLSEEKGECVSLKESSVAGNAIHERACPCLSSMGASAGASERHTLADFANKLPRDWEEIQDQLPDFYKWDIEYVTTHGEAGAAAGCWTCSPLQDVGSEQIPLTIAEAPVVLPIEHQWPPIGGVHPPPDPRPSALIDCRTEMSLETIRDIFLTFEGTLGFYVLISGLLQIIVSDTFDTTWASSHLPHRYGGLKVCYITKTMEPTMLQSNVAIAPRTNALSQSQSSQLMSATGQARSGQSLQLNDFIEARVSSTSREKFAGKIGLKVEKDSQPYLIMSTHVITEAILSKSFFGLNRDPLKRLQEDWNKNAEIWAGNAKIGKVEKSYDQAAEYYPTGFYHDVTLIRPNATASIGDIRSPISDIGWLNREAWSSLRQQPSSIKILGPTDASRAAKCIKCNVPSEAIIVGEGIFYNQTAAAGSKPMKKHDLSTWNRFVSRAVLYRVNPEFNPPNGYSGIALYADGTREDGTQGPGIVGFQSFVQKSDHPQKFNMPEGPHLERRLKEGRVAFYGAFQVPDEIRRAYSIL